MINNDVIVGTTDTGIVKINEIELSARLGRGIDRNSDVVDQCIELYNQKVAYRYVYAKLSYKSIGNLCYFEEESVCSPALSKVLQDSQEVILLAVTVGIEVDKLINKILIQNPSSALCIDAVASAGIESYIDYISNQICVGLNVTKRFSPGYADFPLEFQSYLLNRLSANESIGITLSKDLLMIPTKSITAVIGIK